MIRNVKDYDERRVEILTAAQDLFLSRGYETTTIQEIIDAVGIAKGTFYHYFDSKASLLDALVESMTDQRLQTAQAILERHELNAAQKLQRIFSEIEVWKTDNRKFFLEILRTWYSDENIIVRFKLSSRAKRVMQGVLAQIIRQGVAEGTFNTPYPEGIGEVILGLLENTSDELASLLLDMQSRELPLSCLEEKLAVNQHAINLLLGAQPGEVQIYNLERLKLWFEE
jgi:AcrR family transcriptional regulator